MQRTFSYLILCGCLTAAEATPSKTTPTAEESPGWLQTLSNLPVVRWFIPPAVEMDVHVTPPPAPCDVAPLPSIVDHEALEFEKATGPAGAVDVGGLMPAMARALERFRRMVTSAGGTFELKSVYRPPAYQAHLQQVWFKWMELRRNREPGCQALRAQVEEEFTGHHLMESQKPVTSSDHTRGMAFDAAVALPKVARLKKRRVSLDRLALLAGIKRPDIFRDPVHFKLVLRRGARG